MKQIGYIVHRPLTEAKGSGKHLDKVIQNIVNDLPSNPSWDDIQDGYDKAKSYEQTKSSWSGGLGLGIDKNYFHRVAKKLNLPFIFTDGDGERPGRVKADGTGTGYFMDPLNSSKDEAEEMNKRGILSPTARIFYDLNPPKSAAKPDEPEPEAEKPKEKEPEGPRTQTGAGALRFKDDDKELDIDNLDDYLAGGGSVKPGSVSKPDRPVPSAEIPNVNKDDSEQATTTSGGSEAPTLANKKDEHPCPDAYFFYNNTGNGYAVDFYMNSKAQPVRVTDPSLNQSATQNGIGALNKALKSGEIDCQKLAAGDGEGSGAAAVLGGVPGVFMAGSLLRKKPALPPKLPTDAGRLKPNTTTALKPTADKPATITPEKPINRRPVGQTSSIKPPASTEKLPTGSKIVQQKPTKPSTDGMPEANPKKRPLKKPQSTLPQYKQNYKPRVTASKPKPTNFDYTKVDPKLDKPVRPPAPDEPIKARPLEPNKVATAPEPDLDKLNVSNPKPTAPIKKDLPKLKIDLGDPKPITWDIKVKYPEKILQQVDLPETPPVETNKLKSRLKDLSKRFEELFRKYRNQNPWPDILKRLQATPNGKALAQALTPIENLSGRLKVQDLDPPELKKLSDYLALNADNNKWSDKIRDFEIDLDRGNFKINNEIFSLGDDLAAELKNSNLDLKRRPIPSSQEELYKLIKNTPSSKIPVEWFNTPGATDDLFKNYNIKNNSLLGKILTNPKLPDPPTAADFGKLATNKNLGLDIQAQDKLSKQLRQSFNGQSGTLDLDKLKLNLAKLIKIDPSVDEYTPKEKPKNVGSDGFDKQTFDFNVSDEMNDPVQRKVPDDTKDRFAGLDDKGIDSDATARAIRDRAQRQLQDVEAEMNKAEQITNAERRAKKIAEIEAGLEAQRKAARAELSNVEGELNTAQKKAHRAHIAAIDDLKVELSSTGFTSDTKPGTMPSTPDAERQALKVADELTRFVGKLEKGTYPNIPASELDALKVGDMPSGFHSKLEKGTYPEIPDAERQALLSVDPGTTFTSKAKPGTFPDTPDAERLAISGDDPKTRFVRDKTQSTFEPGTEMQAARDRVEELQKKSTKAARELKASELADEQFVKDYQDAVTAEKIRHRKEILRLEKIQAQGQEGRDAAAEERRAKAYEREIGQLEADRKKVTQQGWEILQQQEATRGEQLVDDETRKVLAQDAGIENWEYDPTKATSQVNTAAAQQADMPKISGASSPTGSGAKMDPNNIIQRDVPSSSMSGQGSSAMSGATQDAIKKAKNAVQVATAATSMNAAPGQTDADDITSKDGQQAEMPKPAAADMDPGASTTPGSQDEIKQAELQKLDTDTFLQDAKEVQTQNQKAIDDSGMIYDNAPAPDPSTKTFNSYDDFMAHIKKENPDLHKKLEQNGIDTPEKLNAFKEANSANISDKRIIEDMVKKLNQSLEAPENANSEVGRLQHEALKEGVEKAGGPEAFVKQMLEKIKAGAIATRAAKAATKKLAAKLLKIGAGVATGGFGVLMTMLDATDPWLIYDIGILTGLVDDPDDRLADAREEDKQKVEDILNDKEMSLEQKKAEIKRIFWYSETWYEHTINFLMTSITQFGRSGALEQWDPGQFAGGEPPQPITIGGEPIGFGNYNKIKIKGVNSDVYGRTGPSPTQNDIDDLYSHYNNLMDSLRKKKFIDFSSMGSWRYYTGNSGRVTRLKLGELHTLADTLGPMDWISTTNLKKADAHEMLPMDDQTNIGLNYDDFIKGNVPNFVQKKYAGDTGALQRDQEALKKLISTGYSTRQREMTARGIGRTLKILKDEINEKDFFDNRADALFTHSMAQLDLQRLELPKMESKKQTLQNDYNRLLEQLYAVKTAKYSK